MSNDSRCYGGVDVNVVRESKPTAKLVDWDDQPLIVSGNRAIRPESNPSRNEQQFVNCGRGELKARVRKNTSEIVRRNFGKLDEESHSNHTEEIRLDWVRSSVAELVRERKSTLSRIRSFFFRREG